jgi:hypothetical protein
MNKFFKILIAGVFLTGFITSVICLACTPRIAMGCCHNKVQPASVGDESCLAHCAKQKTFTVSVESNLSVELKNQGAFFVKSSAPVNLQTIPASLEINMVYYVSQSVIKVNTGQVYLAPLFNHSPPLLL